MWNNIGVIHYVAVADYLNGGVVLGDSICHWYEPCSILIWALFYSLLLKYLFIIYCVSYSYMFYHVRRINSSFKYFPNVCTLKIQIINPHNKRHSWYSWTSTTCTNKEASLASRVVVRNLKQSQLAWVYDDMLIPLQLCAQRWQFSII